MSHFVVLVILPKNLKDRDQQEAAIQRLLAPYSEERRVPPYLQSCSCVNHKAVVEANAQINQKDSLEGYRAHWRTLRKDEQEQTAWEEFLAPWQSARDTLMQAHPEYNKPDARCADCQGTGLYETTYNPQSKWDWWVIGGRWAGALEGVNMAVIEGDVLRHLYENPPFAILTPDGVWHEKGEMGWWGIVDDEKPDLTWQIEEAGPLLRKHEGHVAAAVDCHI